MELGVSLAMKQTRRADEVRTGERDACTTLSSGLIRTIENVEGLLFLRVEAARLEDRAASTPETHTTAVGVEAALCSTGAA